MQFPILTTKRLVLTELKETDAQEIFTLRSDENVNRYIDRQRATKLEDAENFINKPSVFDASISWLAWAGFLLVLILSAVIFALFQMRW